ncbi:MAG: molybdenum cofactor guanylyltransferase MobA [Nitratireductor sp.]
MMIESDEVTGVILAGGLSRRMGGTEKSLADLAGKPLISHVRDRLMRQLNTIVLNANGDPARFAILGLPVQNDTIGGFAGPLAGILAGMRWASANVPGSRFIATVAADTPFFPATLVNTLRNQHDGSDEMIALATSQGNRHPVFGLWPVSLADALEDFLNTSDNGKVMLFVRQYALVDVDFSLDTAGHDPFFNVNTPEELEMARAILEESNIG